jgi:hypothetical protein
MLNYVYKKKGSRVYRGRYRISGNPQIFDIPLEEEKRHVAEAILRKMQRQKQDEALGLCPPAALVDAAGKDERNNNLNK